MGAVSTKLIHEKINLDLALVQDKVDKESKDR